MTKLRYEQQLAEKEARLSEMRLELANRDLEVRSAYQIKRLEGVVNEKESANKKLKTMTMGLFDEFVG